MKSNIDALTSQIRELEIEINNLIKAPNEARASGVKVKVGTDYFMNNYSHDDLDLQLFMSAKLEKALAKLEPLAKRLAILDELASETLNKAQGA